MRSCVPSELHSLGATLGAIDGKTNDSRRFLMHGFGLAKYRLIRSFFPDIR